MNLYSVNSLAVLKRVDLKRLPIARSVIASRAIAASSIPSSIPFSIHSSIPSSIPSSLHLPIPSSIPTFQPASLPSTPSSTSSIPFPSSPPVSLPSIPATPSSIPPKGPVIPGLHELIKKDEVKPKMSGREPLDKELIISHLHSELRLPIQDAEQIYLLYGENLLKNYSNVNEFMLMCDLVRMFFSNEELLYNFFPFSLSYFELYNKIQIFKELGFRSINPSMIESHCQIFELTLSQLKRNFGHILNQQECMDSLCKTLAINADDRQALERSMIKQYGDLDSVPVERLRHRGLLQYLSKRLNVEISYVESYCKRYRQVFRKVSIESMKRNVDLLGDRFEYPSNRILHNALFATLNPMNLEDILTKLKRVVGNEAYRKLIHDIPFLKMDVNALIENFVFLKSHCSNQFYLSSAELLKMQNDKLRAVFAEMDSNLDVKALNLKVFGLDYLAMNRVQILGRIQKLKDVEIPLSHVPLSFFVGKDTDFMKFVHNTLKDSELRIRFYLENNFGVSFEEVKNRLRPLPTNASTKYNKQNAKKIVEFFVSMNVSRDQIIDNLNLILFDYKLVKLAYYSACAKYPGKSLHNDPKFFDHIFNYIVNQPKPK